MMIRYALALVLFVGAFPNISSASWDQQELAEIQNPNSGITSMHLQLANNLMIMLRGPYNGTLSSHLFRAVESLSESPIWNKMGNTRRSIEESLRTKYSVIYQRLIELGIEF